MFDDHLITNTILPYLRKKAQLSLDFFGRLWWYPIVGYHHFFSAYKEKRCKAVYEINKVCILLKRRIQTINTIT